jgi:hypothetical protein
VKSFDQLSLSAKIAAVSFVGGALAATTATVLFVCMDYRQHKAELPQHLTREAIFAVTQLQPAMAQRDVNGIAEALKLYAAPKLQLACVYFRTQLRSDIRRNRRTESAAHLKLPQNP